MDRDFVNRILVDHQLFSQTLADLFNFKRSSRFRDDAFVNRLFFPAVTEPSSISSDDLLKAQFSANLFRSRIYSGKVNKNTLLLTSLWV
jgi:hypothetical protein